MCKAIDNCKDKFQLFNKKLDSLNFVSSMIKIYDEMKSCNLDSFQINELSKNIENDVLFKKLSDISLVMSSFEELINGKFNDSSNELNRIYNQIFDKNYFKENIFLLTDLTALLRKNINFLN